jgi:hypothetical protein
MTDPTESIRRQMVADINAAPGSRERLEADYGKVWDTDQLREEFEVVGFLAPLVVVRRKSDGVRGSLMFQHNPRFYFRFQPE